MRRRGAALKVLHHNKRSCIKYQLHKPSYALQVKLVSDFSIAISGEHIPFIELLQERESVKVIINYSYREYQHLNHEDQIQCKQGRQISTVEIQETSLERQFGQVEHTDYGTRGLCQVNSSVTMGRSKVVDRRSMNDDAKS